ncbi:hypothetical protein FK538_06695 [Acinetobacter indicus]|uniref:hypothetical protein n=1 Tax=Acinetobacter indicus TaxID=756892 RepID=UPI00143FE1D8|nr:hypothetical protein [Acinetobacter indicus]QIZ61707.1 hypothetical protein FK538_06695 [Acinetobacter indicus]
MIKKTIFTIGFMTFLYGCAATPVPAPAPVEPPLSLEINASDTFSRQFITDEADLTPIANSTRPSAVIFFNGGTTAKKFNKALCKGFVQLDPIDKVEIQDGIPVENQVVTKLPVKSDIPQTTIDCDLILKEYDYGLAKVKLTELNSKLKHSYGPFIAIYNPGSTKINQLIDLRGSSEQQLEAFGKNWHTIFTQTAINNQKSELTQKDKIYYFVSLFKKIIKTSICVTKPNLIYIFNESAGEIAEQLICNPDDIIIRG